MSNEQRGGLLLIVAFFLEYNLASDAQKRRPSPLALRTQTPKTLCLNI